jgi:hypothetical protein
MAMSTAPGEAASGARVVAAPEGISGMLDTMQSSAQMASCFTYTMGELC